MSKGNLDFTFIPGPASHFKYYVDEYKEDLYVATSRIPNHGTSEKKILNSLISP